MKHLRRSRTASPRVAIIGAGFGGISAGVMLTREGIDNFDILERAPGLGGTWWFNRYPGAEVDTPSSIYSFSFMPGSWSRTHAKGPEIRQYLEDAVDQTQLREHIRFNTSVSGMTWDPERSGYHVAIDGGETEFFDAVISAVGFLNIPSYPDWAKSDSFQGQVFHSARWPEGIDLTESTVAVIGTGSTSVQIVSELATEVKQLLVFQRQPNWILPKRIREHSVEERERMKRPLAYGWKRLRDFAKSERGRSGGREATVGSRANSRSQSRALAHLHEALGDREDLLEALTPNYPFYGKRPVINDTYYPTLRRDDVSLIPHAVEDLVAGGILDTTGKTHEVDVVVLATGFEAANYQKGLEITGIGGRTLHEEWDGEPRAFGGVTVPSFPNFFMIYGPNTNAGPVPYFLEAQAKFAAKSLRTMRARGASTITTSPRALQRYSEWLERRLQKTVWGKTANYFTSASGRVVTQWPSSALHYGLMLKLLRRTGLRIS